MGYNVVSSLDNNITTALDVIQRNNVDFVILVAATTAGESQDRPSLNLDFNADELIFAVSSQKPTVVLVQAPGTVLMPWSKLVPAIGIIFLGGEHTSSAWEAVVF